MRNSECGLRNRRENGEPGAEGNKERERHGETEKRGNGATGK